MPKLTIKSLSIIKQNPATLRVGEALDDVATGTNNLAAQLSADPNGSDITPANVAQVQAQHLGNGLVDVAITDNSSLSRAINYYIEADTSPNFTSNPRGITTGPIRNGSLVLPNGTYYVRAYSQYPAGGPPSKPVNAAQPIVVTGSASLPLLASQGSGTGNPGQGGQGAGKTINR
jgi:hypothetical protein